MCRCLARVPALPSVTLCPGHCPMRPPSAAPRLHQRGRTYTSHATTIMFQGGRPVHRASHNVLHQPAFACCSTLVGPLGFAEPCLEGFVATSRGARTSATLVHAPCMMIRLADRAMFVRPICIDTPHIQQTSRTHTQRSGTSAPVPVRVYAAAPSSCCPAANLAATQPSQAPASSMPLLPATLRRQRGAFRALCREHGVMVIDAAPAA